MTADEIVSLVKDLPVVSETARKLTTQLNQPDLHRDELVHTLRHDNVLTAKVLRACNSAATGAREPVLSIDQALLLLGDAAIFRIVSAVGFGDCLGLTAPGYDTEANGLWSHSLCAALGAEYPVQTESYGGFLPSTAFTAGLLHDIGKTVINRILTPKARADIRAKIATESLSRVEAERAVLGADHSEVGACLLQRWSLPEQIIEAVANHHAPVFKPEVRLSAVVHLANCIAHLGMVSPGWEAHSSQASETAAAVLGLDAKKAEEIVSGIHAAMQNPPQLKAAA
jgi:putative nucleotidyltransferase with HDIG domain